MLACDAPQIAYPVELAAAVVVGRKPPWNQPQVTPLAFRRSPTLRPVSATRPAFGLEQSSSCGSGSPTTVPATTAASSPSLSSAGSAPCVLPATRFRAPGVDGPNPVPKELSPIAKCWA